MSLTTSLIDAGKVAVELFGELYVPIRDAIEKGTAREILRQSLLGSIRTSEAVAVARVEARSGKPVSALQVAAIHLEDAASDLEQLGQDEDAVTLRRIAARYRTSE
jgi:hypothetical protein